MRLKIVLPLLIVLTIAVIFILYIFKIINLDSFFTPVSVVSKVIVNGELKKTDGKTNILALGVDQRSSGNVVQTYLTDTIMVMSLDAKNNKVAMISIPRDLWVDKYKTKINSVYAAAIAHERQRILQENNNSNVKMSTEEVAKAARDAAIPNIKAEVERIVGLPIHYYAIVGFDVFKDSIAAVDGIEVDVQNTFDDYEYPIEGMENAEPISARYEHVHFDKGLQKMDGPTALKYARSRHSDNPLEAGDFNRARRQQAVVIAIKDKIMSSETLLNPTKMTGLYESFKNNIQTDMDVADFILFFKEYKDMKFESNTISKIVLSNENSDDLGAGTLMAPDSETRAQLYNGAYVLVPTAGTYEEIQAIVREALFK